MESSSPSPDSAGVRVPPPFIYLGGLVLGFVLEAVLPGSSVPARVQWGLGGSLLVAGLALAASFNMAFQRHGTAVEPWKPTTAVVSTGPYRLTRNPAYVAMALLYSGIAVLSDALWALAPLPLVLLIIDRGVIAREERYLESKFGPEYLDYKGQVRRWV